MSEEISAADMLKHEQFMTAQKNMAFASYQKTVAAYSNYISQMASPDRSGLFDEEDRIAKKMLKRAVKEAKIHWAGFVVAAS